LNVLIDDGDSSLLAILIPPFVIFFQKYSFICLCIQSRNIYIYTFKLYFYMAKPQPEQQVFRVRIPQKDEILGIVQQRLGGSRMRVLCLDGKERMCRIPGRLRRALWVRENDVVIIQPWELGGDNKADIIYKYRGKAEVEFLKRKGYLKNLDDEF
jgi:translation initiation factor 1A